MNTTLHMTVRLATRCLALAMVVGVLISPGPASFARVGGDSIEEKVKAIIASEDFQSLRSDNRCHDRRGYRVYLIDNFEQRFHLVPEVLTSHGEMLVRLLEAGREDIDVRVLNTSLSKGLAMVIRDLVEGACADAVVSSTPGSNYTYGQIGSLLDGRARVTADNILDYRADLRRLLHRIAHHGFPSVEWLRNVDVNPAKLRNDARKLLFIEALGRFRVPVILPYGNADARYKGEIRAVNLLSLASNAKVYSALDRSGERVAGFPYSPLSSGDAPAFYRVVEHPHPDDPFKAILDINEDGRRDYTFFRVGRIAYRNETGALAFAPPVMRQDRFAVWRSRAATDPRICREEEVVLTAEQYRRLQPLCPELPVPEKLSTYVWLNGPRERAFFFDPTCWERGAIRGTSVIPPHKAKELLPRRSGTASGDAGASRPQGGLSASCRWKPASPRIRPSRHKKIPAFEAVSQCPPSSASGSLSVPESKWFSISVEHEKRPPR